VPSELQTRTGRIRNKFPQALIAFVGVAGLIALGWIWWNGGKASTRLGPTNGVLASNAPRAKVVAPEKPARVPAEVTLLPTNAPPLPRPSLPAPELKTAQPTAAPIAQEALVSSSSGLSSRAERILRAQCALVRQGVSPGSLDGALGGQTRAAVEAYFRREGKITRGDSNGVAQLALSLSVPLLATYTITSNDLARLLPLSKTWLDKSQQARMDYETILELVAERSQSHPNLIRQLNPGFEWTNLAAGATLRVPNAEFPALGQKAAFARISLSARTLEAFDENTNLLAHFPCSIAQRVEKRPVGELHVAVLAPNPNYTFDPEVFPESVEARELNRKLILQPGPNNPVGTVWIGLDKPGYGIHGTPRPEEVGRTESHGCFRLANWNAEFLLRLVTVGTPFYVEP
jgi:lipoprotein-anchoring transpeptidase ErfK/SrfK